jgi:hypothetical protein
MFLFCFYFLSNVGGTNKKKTMTAVSKNKNFVFMNISIQQYSLLAVLLLLAATLV